jgi:hypothetical protein
MTSRISKITAAMLALSTGLSACAGRAPNPVQVSQPQDAAANCFVIQAEIDANAAKIEDLRGEENWKIAQNVATTVVGVAFFWPLLFAGDLQDAAGVEKDALKRRNDYLTQIAAFKRCGSGDEQMIADRSAVIAKGSDVIVRTYLPGGRPVSAQR